MNFFEKIKGFLLSPKKTFDETKEDTLTDAFKYFLPILVIFAVLSTGLSFFVPLGLLDPTTMILRNLLKTYFVRNPNLVDLALWCFFLYR